MNKIMHDAINKFNAINLMCGTVALEVESGLNKNPDGPQLGKRINDLLVNVKIDLDKARTSLEYICGLLTGELDCYKENEHFFKVIRPGIKAIEDKAAYLKEAVAGEPADSAEHFSWESNVVSLLHGMEERALACGIVLKELRSSLISSGKYDTKAE